MLLDFWELISWVHDNQNQNKIHEAELILTVGILNKCTIIFNMSYSYGTTITALSIQISWMKEKSPEINTVLSSVRRKFSILCFHKAGLREKC